MDFFDVLREMLRTSGNTATGMSQKLGRSNSFLSMAFHDKKSPRTDTLAAICEACGYELIIRGRGSEYTLSSQGTGKDTTLNVSVADEHHWWHMTPDLTDADGNKPQTTVLEDRHGARVLVDYRVLSDLTGKGWGVGWDDDIVLKDERPSE